MPASKEETEALEALFRSISLDEKLAKESARNAKFATNLAKVIEEAGCAEGGLEDKKRGNLLYTVAGKFPVNALDHRTRVVADVMAGELKTPAQLDGCCKAALMSSLWTRAAQQNDNSEWCNYTCKVITG